MTVDELDISKGALRMLSLMGISEISELIKIDEKNLQLLRSQNIHNRNYFDEIFAAVKNLGLTFAFESDYYLNLGIRKANLASISIDELVLTPTLRNYLEPYDNLEAFFNDITSDNVFRENRNKKKIKKFLVNGIKADQNYDWLIELCQHLGNKGALLALVIKKFIGFLKQTKIDANSLLEAVIEDSRIVIALNKQDIYFLGDLVKFDERTLGYFNGVGKRYLEAIKKDLATYGYKLGKELPNYYDFAFDFSKFDIQVLELRKDLESNLRQVGVNNLNDLIVVEYAKYFSDYDNQIITDSYRKLGFDWGSATINKALKGTYAEANEWLQELKKLREMYSVRMTTLEKNSSFIARYFPTTIPVLNSQNYRELVGTSSDFSNANLKDLKMPKKIQDYLSSYENLNFFFYEIANTKTYEKDRSKNHLKRFLMKNIKADENYNGLINTLRNFGNDGALLALIILKYQNFLQDKKMNLNMPVSKVITSKRIVTALLSLNIYFIGDLVKHSSEKLESMEGIGLSYLREIEEDLQRCGYQLGMSTDSYFNFEFKMASFDISILGLEKELETGLREIEINNLSELITSKDTKFWLEEQNNRVFPAYRKLGFFPMQGFNYPVVDSSYNEINQCLTELDLLIARYNELLLKTYKYNIALQDADKSMEASSNNNGFGRG